MSSRARSNNFPTLAVWFTAPAIIGTPTEGAVTSCTAGSYSDTTATFTYQWTLGGVSIVGATSATHTPTTGDVGSVLRRVTTASKGVDQNRVSVSAGVTVAGLATPAGFPLSIHSSGRYLIDVAGNPFFVHGDSGWSAVGMLSDAQIDQYVDNRAAKGFTLILIEAPVIEYTTNGNEINVDGVAPFTVMTPNWNWTLNNTYWARVDRLVNRCKLNGMAVLINPAYFGYNGAAGTDGCMAEITAASAPTLQAYGAALATRYNQGNVIWSMGGDWPGTVTERDKQWNIVTGMRTVRTTDLITAHPASSQRSFTYWEGYTGYNLHWAYAYESLDAAYAYNEVAAAYGNAPTRPTIFGEGLYENSATGTLAMLRRQSYGGILGGACGQIYGNNPVWHFQSPQWAEPYTGTWQTNMDSTGATEQTYVKALFSAYSWWKLQPRTDTSLVTSALSSGASRVVPALASDGTFAMIYVPSSQTVTVNTTALTGVVNVRIRLYNPTSGAYTTVVASEAKTTARAIPTGGERVIVIDSTATTTFSWTSNGSDSYEVGWDTVTHAGGDVNNPELYPNVVNVGTATSWTNTQGVIVYAAVRSRIGTEIGPWSTQVTLSA